MRIQANKYLRELPEAYKDDKSYEKIQTYNVCPHCRTELFCQWLWPKSYSYSLLNQNAIDCWIRYHGRDVLLKDTELRSFAPNNEFKFFGIPSEVVSKQLDKLEAGLEEVKKAAKEQLEYESSTGCPVCGGILPEYIDCDCQFKFDMLIRKQKVTKEEYEAFEEYESDKEQAKLWTLPEHIGSMSVCFDFLNFRLKRKDQKAAEKKFNTLCAQLDVPAFPEGVNAAEIKNDPEKLKAYIYNLFTLETNIYSVSKRLRDLYDMQIEQECCVYRHDALVASDIRKDVQASEEEYNEKLAALKAVKKKQVETISVAEPATPNKPIEPVPEKPGLFNKKKVLEYNAKLMSAYEKACEQYKTEYAQYQAALEACREKARRLQQEAEEAHALRIAEAEAQAESAKAHVEQCKAEVEDKIKNALALPSAESVTKKMLDDEIVQAENLLKELYDCRNKLYACDIVFGKYRNLVALATFYEYLLAGRCESLEGANGAYNIFEAECRANQIIGQLTKIVDSLEQIKESQYLVYTQLQSINHSLNTMHDTMRDVSKSLREIKTEVGHVSDYMATVASNTDVIAHNTAVSAYYGKMNAELTKSLGYLIALK